MFFSSFGPAQCLLYGATEESQLFLTLYPNVIDGVIDRSYTVGDTWNSLPIINVDAINEDTIVIIGVTAGHLGDVEKIIKSSSSLYLHVFDFINLVSNNMQFSYTEISPTIVEWATFPTTFMNNINIFNDVANSLSDKSSIDTFDQYLNARLTGNLHYLSRNNEFHEPNEMYFQPFLGNLEKYTFIDIGAFDGANSIAFCKQNTIQKAICFEPEVSQYTAIKKITKEYNITTVNALIGNENGFSNLVVNGDRSYESFSETDSLKATQSIPKITLDSYLNTNEHVKYFIKMDIEGGELNALLGANKIIKNQNNIIAISMYHHSSDFVDIWPIISKIIGKRRISFRHLTCGACESVLFIYP